MNDTALEKLARALEEAAERVERTARTVAPWAWEDVIHTGDGAWTRRKLLAHMAANDARQFVRLRIGAGIPLPNDEADLAAGLDVDAWNEARIAERAGLDLEALFAEMRERREGLVALLRSLTPEQRDRPMPFRGDFVPLETMISTVIGHLDQHSLELTGPALR